MNPPPLNEPSASSSRVLIIDDDRAFCALIRDYLASFGYAVSAAHTGPAGVDAALAEPWHAIILDVMLPGLDGFEVLRKIRRASEVRVNPAARTAAIGGQPLTLTPGEFDMLLSLARAKGRVKTRDALLSEIRDREWEVFDRAIDVQISALRKKLGDDPKAPRFIRTVRSAGYMLVDPDAPPL